MARWIDLRYSTFGLRYSVTLRCALRYSAFSLRYSATACSGRTRWFSSCDVCTSQRLRRYLPLHFFDKKRVLFSTLYCQKWWWKMVISMIFFTLKKTRNLQFLSLKISNSAHPVKKIQCLLNGKKWQ